MIRPCYSITEKIQLNIRVFVLRIIIKRIRTYIVIKLNKRPQSIKTNPRQLAIPLFIRQ